MALICGIDEAGRGCVAGSLFVAGFVCDDNEDLFALGIKDSKKLSRSKRFALESTLRDNFATHIVQKSAAQIDAQGLSALLRDALQEIMEHFAPLCDRFIFDGNTSFNAKPPNGVRLETLVQGDMLVAAISCASIIAKCAKDRESLELDKRFPQYGLAKHCGYGTKAHYEALRHYGLSPIHRASFLTHLGFVR